MIMKRFEEIGESFLFLFGDYSKERKHKIKKALNDYEFKKRRKDDSPHPNSLEANGDPKLPTNYVEAILKIMHPYYNANTANRIRVYILDHL
jgi:hypothetical protein